MAKKYYITYRTNFDKPFEFIAGRLGFSNIETAIKRATDLYNQDKKVRYVYDRTPRTNVLPVVTIGQ